jgi:hypothetical protein
MISIKFERKPEITKIFDEFNKIKEYEIWTYDYNRLNYTWRDFEIYKTGISFDYVNYLYNKLQDFKPGAYLLSMSGSLTKTNYHAFCIVKYEDLYYLIECGISENRHILVHETEEYLIDHILHLIKAGRFRYDKDILYNLYKYKPINKHFAKDEFINYVIKNSEHIVERKRYP